MKPLDKTERYTLSQIVGQNLKQMILQNGMAPGEKLPAERDLSLSLGVSRAILREALRSLESFGIVEIKHGEGTFVAANFLNPLLEQLPFVMRMKDRSAMEMHELRYVLEAGALSLNLQPSPDTWAKLEAMAERLSDPALEPEKRAALDAEFHRTLIGSLGNRTLLYLAEPFLKLQEEALLSEEEVRRSSEEHRQYLDAIREGETDRAAAILRRHLQAGRP
ncbi:GntR family transcriptional regulator [Paenibacillus aurantius]|uniref:GntR family transcriptional regulator n=1 Tax=Paenibacillus aurantius TaxID=2918900 RepID=A0AA96LHA6_9BACL|nr:GntR family transcriptional regulator [Paenibacillus aurantius]WNQ12050.1 GntR family transcriptional regulator [Paenibacillus aurantius]